MIASAVHIDPNQKPLAHNYDLLFNAVGFESRAMHASQSPAISAKRFASLAFPVSAHFKYRYNLEFARRMGAHILFDPLPEMPRESFVRWCFPEGNEGSVSIAIDISSMNRSMIAASLMFCARHLAHISRLSIIYSPQTFVQPPKEFVRLEAIGPTLPELGGHDSDTGLPVGLMISVGFEYGVAVGLINKVEPQLTVCFHGIGGDPRFEDAVREANMGFNFGAGNVQVSQYSLRKIPQAFAHIDTIANGMIDRFRVVAIPLGPKVLAALMSLLAMKYFGKIALWRVVEQRSEPRDALAAGPIMVVEIELAALRAAAHGIDFGDLTMFC